ncbi:YqzL family protein [Priestia megaterium]|nr:YqzL family protein [Priestia megaterium]
MLNFTWNIFSQTGSIDTYLLFKELEKEVTERPGTYEDDNDVLNSPIS